MRFLFIMLASICMIAQVGASPDSRTPSGLTVYLVKSCESATAGAGTRHMPWAASPWSEDFTWIDTGGQAPLRSHFKALYDPEALYILFECEAPEAEFNSEPFDSVFYRAIEVFLDPSGDGDNYLEYAATPQGDQHATIWHGKVTLREWTSDYYAGGFVKVNRLPSTAGHSSIQYEVTLPWNTLKNLSPRQLPPARGEAWRANFSRVIEGPLAAEFAGDFAWACPGTYYMHQPNSFGWLVFAGAKNEVQTAPVSEALRPRIDKATQIDGAPHFRPWSRIFWMRYPLIPAGDGCYFALTKNAVYFLGVDGSILWTRTRRDGLPQVIRSYFLAGDELYVAGNGLGMGVVKLDLKGRVKPAASLARTPTVYGLGRSHLLLASGRQFRLLTGEGDSVSQSASAAVLAAASLNDNLFVLGTEQGYEIHGADGHLIESFAVAGGITTLTPTGDGLLALSGGHGFFHIDKTGQRKSFPSRIKFDGLFPDKRGHIWAAYTGGFELWTEGVSTPALVHEPAGLTGFQIRGLAEAAGGRLIFWAETPSPTYYRSGRLASFLLIYDGKHWKTLTFRDGLPGYITGLTNSDDKIFVSTSAGIFILKK